MKIKIIKEIVKKGLSAAKDKFGDSKIKKAFDEIEKKDFDFKDMAKGKGVFKDFTVKDAKKLENLVNKNKIKKERIEKLKKTKQKFDESLEPIKSIPKAPLLGAAAAAEGSRRVMEKSRGGAVYRKKSIDGIAIKGFTRAKHR